MITCFREFDESDWYGWGGADPFSKDSPPLIGTITINPIISGVIIFCKQGVDIYLGDGGFNNDKESDEEWSLQNCEWLQTKEQAERFADFVNWVGDEYDLRMLGFICRGNVR